MTFAVNPTVAGQLPNAAASLYAATGESLYVKNITLANRTGGALAVTIYHRVGGVNYAIFNETIAGGAVVTGGGRLIANGEEIWGVAASATSVDYLIDGVAES